MIRFDEINYLTLRGDGTISYLPKGNEDGRWARDGRQNGRPASIIKKVLTPKALKLFKDSDFESFANKYKSHTMCGEISVLPASEIPDIYCYPLDECGGTLGSSCMNGDRSYVEIYQYVPKLRIACMFSEDGQRLRGRALLWTMPDGLVFMDRVYSCKDHEADMFVKWAESNGYAYKKNFMSYKDPNVWIINGKEVEKSYCINTRTDFDYYPYIDTFRYGGDDWLSNNQRSDFLYDYDNTDGSRGGDDDDDYSTCARTGNRYHNDDLRYIHRGEYADECIHYDYAVYCDSDGNYYYESDDSIVEVHGDFYRKDDDRIVEIDGEYYHVERDNVHWSDFHDEYVFVNECEYSQHHESYIKRDECYEVAGEYYHESVVNKLA
jgi:hypothetical protein